MVPCTHSAFFRRKKLRNKKGSRVKKLHYVCHGTNPETDDTKVEQAITHLGNCLHDKSRHWLENHVATKRPRDDEGRVKRQNSRKVETNT